MGGCRCCGSLQLRLACPPLFVHVRNGECTNTRIHRHTQPGPKGSSFESVSPGRLGVCVCEIFISWWLGGWLSQQT